jgi:hypothetical protein
MVVWVRWGWWHPVRRRCCLITTKLWPPMRETAIGERRGPAAASARTRLSRSCRCRLVPRGPLTTPLRCTYHNSCGGRGGGGGGGRQQRKAKGESAAAAEAALLALMPALDALDKALSRKLASERQQFEALRTEPLWNEVAAAVSRSCACIGSPCLRHCVHGASIGGGGGGAPPRQPQPQPQPAGGSLTLGDVLRRQLGRRRRRRRRRCCCLAGGYLGGGASGPGPLAAAARTPRCLSAHARSWACVVMHGAVPPCLRGSLGCIRVRCALLLPWHRVWKLSLVRGPELALVPAPATTSVLDHSIDAENAAGMLCTVLHAEAE